MKKVRLKVAKVHRLGVVLFHFAIVSGQESFWSFQPQTFRQEGLVSRKSSLSYVFLHMFPQIRAERAGKAAKLAREWPHSLMHLSVMGAHCLLNVELLSALTASVATLEGVKSIGVLPQLEPRLKANITDCAKGRHLGAIVLEVVLGETGFVGETLATYVTRELLQARVVSGCMLSQYVRIVEVSVANLASVEVALSSVASVLLEMVRKIFPRFKLLATLVADARVFDVNF